MNRTTQILLNLAHALDHLFLLIFAAAVGAIAQDFGLARWEDMMPYTTGAFVLFGLGSVPSGRLGDLWGRRRMMLVFFFGMGASALAVACTRTPMEMAIALVVLGAFSSIYHPVGIPMLVQSAVRPGWTIGVNGLAGNLGIAAAALSTGFLVEHFGWRAAFVVPAVLCMGLGLLFAWQAPAESATPARSRSASVQMPKSLVLRTFLVMVITATTTSLLFNFTTNGNAQLLADRLQGLVSDPSTLGLLLAAVYAIGSLAQLVVGRLLDRVAVKPLFVGVLIVQCLAFAVASQTTGWHWYLAAIAYMVMVFAAIPFSDAMVVRYIDDSMRSRVSGTRIAISFGISSMAVYLLGPLVKAAGFDTLMTVMACIAATGVLAVLWLPGQSSIRQARALASTQAAG
jgi:MFS family permease